MFVPLHNKDEAHYVCAMLNCSIAVLIVKSCGVETQTSTPVLEYVRLPRYDSGEKRHRRLAELSMAMHELAVAGTEAAQKKWAKLDAARPQKGLE